MPFLLDDYTYCSSSFAYLAQTVLNTAVLPRSVWGFPKTLGHFSWGDHSVNLTVHGKLIFSATFDGKPLIQDNVTEGRGDSKNSQYTPTTWWSNVAAKGIQTMQFPIRDTVMSAAAEKLYSSEDSSSSSSNGGDQPWMPSSALDSATQPDEPALDLDTSSPEEAIIAQYMLAGIHPDNATTAAVPDPPSNSSPFKAFAPFADPANQGPNLQTLNFPGCISAFTIAATSVRLNPVAFTGRKSPRPAHNKALGVFLMVGTPGEFTMPVQLSC